MGDDTNLGPICDSEGHLYPSGNIYFYIYGDPAKTDFRNTDARSQIREALHCWERASNFKFVELTDADSNRDYPSFFPRFNFRFGTPQSALHSAETTFENSDASRPRQILYNDSSSWSSMREKSKPVTALFGIGGGVSAPFVNDLWTITMHEVGHALGLAHDGDGNSIMFALDVQDNPNKPVMLEGAIPLIDAIALAKLYGIPAEKPVASLPVNAAGYSIVGGKFVMYESAAMNTFPQTPQETVWGVDEGYLVCAGSGYCISPTVGATRKGWGILYFYVLEQEKVDTQAFVATGGFQMQAADSFQLSHPRQPAPTVATCVPNGRIVAGTKSGVTWGGDWGDIGKGADQPIAHFYSAAYPAQYNYRVMFLKLQNVGAGGARVSGGYQLPPGSAQPASRWGYDQSGFPAREIGRADTPGSRQSTVLSLWCA